MAAGPPIDDDERAHLLAALAELIATRGWARFVLAPIVLPTPHFFPERWTPDATGVSLVSMRLLRYAGLGELGVSMRIFADDREVDATGLVRNDRHAGAAAWFAGIEDEVCYFGTNVGKLDDALGLTAALAHESAHAFRCAHGLMVEDLLAEEQLTDLTAVYLGFGVLVANAASRHRSWAVDGDARMSARSFESLGYLSPQALCFALACQTAARAAPDAAIVRALETNQAAWYRAARAWLDREGDELLARLGIPPRAHWPAAEAFAPDLAAIELEGGDAVEPAPELPAVAELTASRVPTTRALGVGIFGGFVGILLGFQAARVFPAAAAIAFLACTIGGALLGRLRPAWHCSRCDMRVARREPICPGCGARLVRDLARREDRLDEAHDARLDADDDQGGQGGTALPYRDQARLPFEPEDIDGSALPRRCGVLCVSTEGDRVGRFELEKAQQRLDIVLSRSHADYLETLGAGLDSEIVEVWDPVRIARERRASADWLDERHWDALEALDDLDPRLLVIVGATVDGDRIAVHPGHPRHLLWLRREVGQIVDLGEDLGAALDEICALPSDRVRWFAPPSLARSTELDLPGTPAFDRVLARILEFGAVCLQREHEDTDVEQRWLVLVPGIGGTVRLARGRSGPWHAEIATDTGSVDAGRRLAAALRTAI